MASELEDAQAEWDAWPDDGSRCAVGDKPPRPETGDEAPAGMTLAEFYVQPEPVPSPDPEPGGEE